MWWGARKTLSDTLRRHVALVQHRLDLVMESTVMSDAQTSDRHARIRWENRAVGFQRAGGAPKGSVEYFENIRAYRYGYETPFIPRLLTRDLWNKRVLEIGVGTGIDASEIVRNGGIYTGLDITGNHIEPTRRNLERLSLPYERLVHDDLFDATFDARFDVVYCFGVLHHIAHEARYLKRIHSLMIRGGELRVSLYSKFSFFNIFMFATWVVKNRCSVSFNHWQGYVSDGADFCHPVTIKIRTKREIVKLYERCGFEVLHYTKRGFVQNYIPILGRFLRPDGIVLNACGALLGWYHVLHFRRT